MRRIHGTQALLGEPRRHCPPGAGALAGLPYVDSTTDSLLQLAQIEIAAGSVPNGLVVRPPPTLVPSTVGRRTRTRRRRRRSPFPRGGFLCRSLARARDAPAILDEFDKTPPVLGDEQEGLALLAVCGLGGAPFGFLCPPSHFLQRLHSPTNERERREFKQASDIAGLSHSK